MNPWEICLLVSTHIVCVRLSAMQEQVWVRRLCAQNAKNTLFLASQEYPPPTPPLTPPPGLELLMEDLRSLSLKLVKNIPHPSPPPSENENLVGTWDFEF